METQVSERKKVELEIEGMSCSNCAMGISKYLEKQGMDDVMVDFSTAEARFTLEDETELDKVIKGIENLGYHVAGEKHAEEKPSLWKRFTLVKKFYFCLAFTIPLLLHMVIPWGFLENPFVQLVLCIPVFVVGMMHFGKSAFASLKTGVPNMDVLITLGSAAAFFYSLTGTIMGLGPDFMFYETAATIITVVLLGNVIEHRSVQQTTTAIKELSKLQPSKAKKVKEDETVEEIDTKDIRKDDILLVNSGDKVPADGKIVWGECTVDESMVTGESAPVDKDVKDEVIGGTIVSKGSIKIQVKSVGDNTFLANIINLVKSAQQDKPAIQRLADKISAYFVPIVLSITVLTFLLSYFLFNLEIQNALLNSVAVLVIACPCAMGLATPTAVMVGIGKITKQGILIKGGHTIEKLASVKQIVFDKTGTLTTGNFSIKKIKVVKGKETIVKSILYSIEKHSSHPIAVSIVNYLKEAKEIPLMKVRERRGIGITAEDEEGGFYELGSYNIARNATTDSHHDIYLLKDQQLLATVDIQDEIKPDAKEAIEYLKQRGIESVLLSGDNYAKCAYVAQQLGMDNFYFGKLPHEKLEIIEQLSKKKPTAMVGDGINDAPALAKADVGISLSNATEVAIDSAQVILLNGHLKHLKPAMELSKSTVTTIKQNLFWAFAYNIIAIPVAALGFLNPMIAAFSMMFSDIMVVGNSLRLKRKKIS